MDSLEFWSAANIEQFQVTRGQIERVGDSSLFATMSQFPSNASLTFQ